MAGSTLKILEIMNANSKRNALDSSCPTSEPAELDAPQLTPNFNMGNKLEEILNSSLTKPYTPMD